LKAYRYNAFTADGKARKGVIIAETEMHASTLLQGQGLFPTTIEMKKADRATRKRGRISEDMRAVFTRQMAVLLASDLPTDAALDAIQGSGTHPKLQAFAADAKAAVLEGDPLSDALQKADPSMPRYFAAAVRAGETTGDLALVFEELANYQEDSTSDRSQLATALIYPAFVAAVSLMVCAILMVNVAPEIVAMFQVSGRELPQLTKVMLGISDWIGAHWIAIVLVVVCIVFGFIFGLKWPPFRDRWDNFLLRIPVIRRLINLATAAQYLRTLSLIIGSKQTLVAAAQNAAEVLSIEKYKEQGVRVTKAIQEGETLSDALMHLTVIPAVARQLLSAGEQSARLGKMSERAATLVENWLSNDRKRFAALLDPILMMIVGVMVLVIVLSVLLPIFDLQSVIGQ
jgi:general secretion pathway protein F